MAEQTSRRTPGAERPGATRPDLRQVIADALNGKGWIPGDYQWAAHRAHAYGSSCRICLGDVDAIADVAADAVMPVVDALRDVIAERETEVDGLAERVAALRAELDRAHAMAAQYADRAITNGKRADKAEAERDRLATQVAAVRALAKAAKPRTIYNPRAVVDADAIAAALGESP